MTIDWAQRPPRSPSSGRTPTSSESVTTAPLRYKISANPNDDTEAENLYNEQDYIRPILQYSEPGSLHLTPCTVQQYHDLGHDQDDPYDLVNGLLVSVPAMDDPEHYSLAYWLVQLLTHLPRGQQRKKIQAYNERPIRLLFGTASDNYEESSASRSPDHPGSSSKAVHPSSSSKRVNKGSSKSHGESSSLKSKSGKKTNDESSSRTDAETYRRPDFCVVDGTAGSENTDTPVSPFELKRERKGEWKNAIMLGEITSTKRMKDLKYRLSEYEREKIPEYIICDRYKLLQHRNPCVEVHKYNENTRCYDKEVYARTDVVKCSFFDYWKLTADQMLNYKYIKHLVKKEKDKIAKQEETVARKDKTIARQQETVDRQEETIARQQETVARQEETIGDLQKENAHIVDYLKGHRNTPPRSFELDDSLLKVIGKTNPQRGEASSSTKPPRSPKSPPLRVRKVHSSDVKTSSRKQKSNKSDKSK